ncbi:hypothetical protein CR513_59161, partial [Mucuna pruriens]
MKLAGELGEHILMAKNNSKLVTNQTWMGPLLEYLRKNIIPKDLEAAKRSYIGGRALASKNAKTFIRLHQSHYTLLCHHGPFTSEVLTSSALSR